jgi:hypothetical protein
MCRAKETGTQSQTTKEKTRGLGLWRRDEDGKGRRHDKKERGGKGKKKKSEKKIARRAFGPVGLNAFPQSCGQSHHE